MSVTGSGIQALNFMGFLARREESLMLNGAQEQAVLKRLLDGRDDRLYERLYGTKFVRDVYSEPRNVDGRNRVMPFWN